jgi:hypothetical protein
MMIEVDKKDFDKALTVDFVEDILNKNKYLCRGRDSKNEWEVNQDGDNFYCTCPRFTIKRKQCKHTIRIMIHKNIPFRIKPDPMQGDFTGNDFPDDLLIDRKE